MVLLLSLLHVLASSQQPLPVWTLPKVNCFTLSEQLNVPMLQVQLFNTLQNISPWEWCNYYSEMGCWVFSDIRPIAFIKLVIWPRYSRFGRGAAENPDKRSPEPRAHSLPRQRLLRFLHVDPVIDQNHQNTLRRGWARAPPPLRSAERAARAQRHGAEEFLQRLPAQTAAMRTGRLPVTSQVDPRAGFRANSAFSRNLGRFSRENESETVFGTETLQRRGAAAGRAEPRLYRVKLRR